MRWERGFDCRRSEKICDPLDDDVVTGGSCLVVLAALRGQEAGGDHVASGTVVLVENVQATFVVIAGVMGRLRDLASGLAKQSLFLDTLLLALSGLAAASVVASLFVSGYDLQLVGEAALVAGVAGGAGDGSVTEEDDVEGDEEQEHDESFDGEESVEVHVCLKEELLFQVGLNMKSRRVTEDPLTEHSRLSKRRTTTPQRIDVEENFGAQACPERASPSSLLQWTYEAYDRKCRKNSKAESLETMLAAFDP
ncbi:hypothetical protein KCU96_g34, partial [Aureobasidium melanogenum]